MRRLQLVYFIVCLGLLLGGTVWLDRNGTPVTATVSSKLEEVAVHDSPRGAWSRRFRVGVTFDGSDRGLGASSVTVPRERFDSLRVGDAIAIRYLPAFPTSARTADRSTLGVLRQAGCELLGNPFLTRFAIWLAVGGAALWLMARIAAAAAFAAGTVWIASALALLFPAPAPTPLAAAETTARVEAVKLITKSPEVLYTRSHGGGQRVDLGFRELAMPYQVVRFRMALPGWPDSVLGVDAVDSGSVPGVAPGAVLPVRYDPGSPRDARLRDGARTFQDRNRYHFRWLVVGAGTLMVFAAALRGSRRRQPLTQEAQ